MFETSSFSWCCSNNSATKKSNRTTTQEEYFNFLAPSVYHLQTTFLNYITENDFNPTLAKVYDIENLREDEPGLIRRKGMDAICPIDGDIGASYVHSIMDDGDDHVGTATHMLSYAWGYVIGDIVDTLVSYCEKVGELLFFYGLQFSFLFCFCFLFSYMNISSNLNGLFTSHFTLHTIFQ